MDIHKPKPWHSVQEFLKEYLIIVVGVLTALAGEQGVESMRNRELVGRGEEALRDNFERFVRFRTIVDREAPCMAARAGEIRAILDKAGSTRRIGRIDRIPAPKPLPWQIDTWDAMVASGAAPHLPQQKAVLYSRIAMSAVDVYAAATHEWEEWRALQSLVGSARPFSEAEEAQTRNTLALALGHAEMVRFFAEHTVARIEGTHLLSRKELEAAAEEGRQSDNATAMCQSISAASN
jgi:hypothetical protein